MTRRASHLIPSLVVASIPVAALAMLLNMSNAPSQRTQTGQVSGTATDDPFRFSNPVVSATDAVSRSLELFPPDHQPFGIVTRLVSLGNLDVWRDDSSPFTEPQAPAWLVGIRGATLRVGDIVPESIPMITAAAVASTPDVSELTVDGAWYAWDANSGALLGRGVLDNRWDQNYATLSAVAEEVLVISTATAVSMPPTEVDVDLAP